MTQWIKLTLDDGSTVTRAITDRFEVFTKVISDHLCIALHFGDGRLYCGVLPEDNGRDRLLHEAVMSGENIDISQWCEFEIKGE